MVHYRLERVILYDADFECRYKSFLFKHSYSAFWTMHGMVKFVFHSETGKLPLLLLLLPNC